MPDNPIKTKCTENKDKKDKWIKFKSEEKVNCEIKKRELNLINGKNNVKWRR